MTPKDRLLQIIRNDFGTVASFARAIGSTHQNVSHFTRPNARNIISEDSKILREAKSIGYNPDWILKGEGEPKLTIDKSEKQGTIFDNVQTESFGTIINIKPEFKQIPFYPVPLNSGSNFDVNLIGIFTMQTVKNYDVNRILVFQNANKELPERFISKNAIIIVDTQINPIENDVIVAVKDNNLILDIYSLTSTYEKIIGKVIEVTNLF